VDIIKSFTTIFIDSEKDRGRQAINKGFARATGDILAWIIPITYQPGAILKRSSIKHGNDWSMGIPTISMTMKVSVVSLPPRRIIAACAGT
jgi:hypothetical protein